MSPEKLTVERLKKELTLPVICAPMFLISGPDLAVAACRAGIGSIDRADTVADIVGELKRDYTNDCNGSGA